MGNLLNRSNRSTPKYRDITPNHTIPDVAPKAKSHPNKNYASNRIKTTKYTILTFLPKNLFEQFHRFANLYFIFVVALNWVPQVQAFGKEIAMVPVVFVLAVTACKDAFEDFRRYRSDKKVNLSKCRIYKEDTKFHQVDWQDVRVGDIMHLSCNDIIPADLLLLRSSDKSGICHVETMNLDGETNLKQRQCITGIRYGREGYKASRFKYVIECDQPNAEIYKFNGFIKQSDKPDDIVPVNQNNIILRGCVMRNTDWIEGIVVYAGHETKSMMNNRNPRYKRSKLERALNRDVIWCVIILLFLCFFCAAGSALWLGQYEDSTQIMFIPYESSEQFNPYFNAFIVFFTYIIIFQSVIPLPLYVSLEIIKLLQVYFINQDLDLYYEPTDKRVECRALNITEDLGQVEYIFSDKTGTLTENQMEFKSCTIAGKNYPHTAEFEDEMQSETGSRYSLANISRTSTIMENLKLETEIQQELNCMTLRSLASVDLTVPSVNQKNAVQEFFLLMAICNTVVVSLHAHEDPMDDEGNVLNSTYLRSTTSTTNLQEKYNLTEKYTPNPDCGYSPQYVKLPPVTQTSTPNNGKQPPLDSKEFPLNAARLEFMPNQLNTPTGSIAGSIAGSSIRSDMSRIRYEAESPDELALVRAASTYNCCLKGRTANKVTVWLPGDGEVDFEILHVLSFDSTRKRMSVIVKHPLTKEIVLYTKGADSAVLSVLARKYKEEDDQRKIVEITEEHILGYAMQGLRTLCMAKKTISKSDYNTWAQEHARAEAAMEDRDQKLMDSACRIESDLDLLGATGIEDKLQDRVPETIYRLRQAGMKVWVLTGDKQETAIQVAYSSQLFDPEQELMVINADNKEETIAIIDHHLKDIIITEKSPSSHIPVRSASTRSLRRTASTKKMQYGLVIDGKTLAFALEEDLEKKFLMLAGKCNSVICCRSSPIQKGMVVRLAREKLQVLTLAIGDGANDVSMINTADVGIGISGQEGMQAVMASDFAIARFHFLEKLLLVHGHWCYNRLARFAAFMFYKSLMTTMVLFWFNLYSGYSGSTHIDSLLLLFVHVLYCAFPPIVNGIMDKDLSPKTLLEDPEIYKVGQKGKTYTRLTFLIMFIDSLFQSVMVHFGCYFGYFEGVGLWEYGTSMVTAKILAVLIHCSIETFTWGYFEGVGLWEYGTTMIVSMILSILLHCSIETQNWTWPQWLTLIISFLSFWVVAITVDSFFMTINHPTAPYWVMQHTISKPTHALVIVISVFTALLPRIVIRTIQMTVFPDEIMLAQQKEKANRHKPHPMPRDTAFTEQRSSQTGTREGGVTPDSGYENRGLDLRHDRVSNNVAPAESKLPDVQVKNGRVRQRQLSNQRNEEKIAETPT